MEQHHSRREFLTATTAATAAAFLAGPAWSAEGGKKGKARKKRSEAESAAAPAGGRKLPVELGLASYTCRKFDLDQTIRMTKKVGLTHIALKDFHLPMNSTADQIREVAAKVRATGLDLYGCGVVYMGDEAAVNRAFEYAKAGDMKVIIGVPQKPELLPLVDAKVKEYNIKVAIHNHGPGDKVFPAPRDVYDKIKNLDKRIGLCIDVGHTMRLGIDPAVTIKECADRLHDVHLKDVSAATAQGGCVEMGRGVIDVPKMLRALVEINYAGIASFEYEKDADDPLAGLAETVGYTRGVLAAL